jgi:DNA-3-methyladenine glycosylase II
MKKLTIRHKNIRKLEPSKNAFASLSRSIIYQQISGKAANAIMKKFLGLFFALPKKEISGWEEFKKFPKPADVLGLTDEQFQSAGVSPQKRGYLRDLANKFLDGTVVPKKFPTMSDDEIRNHLIAVKGIGNWTADMFLIFALNRPNVLPVGDLAIQKGFMRAFKLRTMPDEKKMRKLATEHEGDHTQLSLYLWHIMDNGEDI